MNTLLGECIPKKSVKVVPLGCGYCTCSSWELTHPGADASRLHICSLGVTSNVLAHFYGRHAHRVDGDVALVCLGKRLQLQLASPCSALLHLIAVILEPGLSALGTAICGLRDQQQSQIRPTRDTELRDTSATPTVSPSGLSQW